jgi:hypothetical protein
MGSADDDELAEDDWDGASAAWNEAAEDWDFDAAEDVADEMALDEMALDDECHWCGSPVMWVGYPFCEECDAANERALLREYHRQRLEEEEDDDGTTAAGDSAEEFSDVDDWNDVYEAESR